MTKKTTTTVKKTGTKKSATPKATPAATPMPAPEVLAAVPSFDKKDKRWEMSICEGSLEHYVLPATFESDDAAKAAGEAWLAAYTKANEAGRRKALGWKPAKGGKTIGELASAMEAKVKGKKTDATTDEAKAGGKAKREPKQKKESTRGPSGLDVAATILKDAGKAMTLKDVVDQMLAKELWSTNGKTPHATINAAVHREVNEKGKNSRFTKTGRGEFEYNTASEKA